MSLGTVVAIFVHLLMKREHLFFLSLFLQTEEDYIPYPSVHEVGGDDAFKFIYV